LLFFFENKKARLQGFSDKDLTMKYFLLRKLVILVLILFPAFLFAQQTSNPPADSTPSPTDTPPQKYALVIGNGAYNGGLPQLANPVNDANDMSAALQSLGFTVDTVLNGTLQQMEDASVRLKDRLNTARNAYGFFFYAGHGVQSGGENYLIPVDADIPTENYLKTRALSVQALLDDLNDARNGLNVVVLDACRDNPFGWSRSTSRGLAIITSQPADSIIVYSTSAGKQASDGTGRNGLFTSQLLPNLTTPGLDVKEVFNRTGADVTAASNKEQIPAIYSQFFGTAYLGSAPSDAPYVPGSARPAPLPSPTTGRTGEAPARDETKLWTVGASVGTSMADPWVIGTVRGTLAPFSYSFLEVGMDCGLVSNAAPSSYYSLAPFLNYCYYYPLNETFSLYAGIGGSYIMANYNFPEGLLSLNTFAAGISAGVNIFDMINVSYTFRTDFKGAEHRISAGYFYRFK